MSIRPDPLAAEADTEAPTVTVAALLLTLVCLFGLIALLFLLFALPCFLLVKERGNPRPRPITAAVVNSS